MAAKKELPANFTFEQAIAELEEITEKLETGKESLENSMKLYERGTLLKTFCEKKLQEAEGKWMVLKKNKDGEIEAQEVKQGEVPGTSELF